MFHPVEKPICKDCVLTHRPIAGELHYLPEVQFSGYIAICDFIQLLGATNLRRISDKYVVLFIEETSHGNFQAIHECVIVAAKRHICHFASFYTD
jgi:hypothetical protein